MLTREQLIAIVNDARVTQLDKATGTPNCAANHDSMSVGYAWTLGRATGSASSCKHPIDPSDSLVVGLHRVSDTIPR